MYCTDTQGPDGVDLEMNLNGSSSRYEDEDFGDIVSCYLLCSSSYLYLNGPSVVILTRVGVSTGFIFHYISDL